MGTQSALDLLDKPSRIKTMRIILPVLLLLAAPLSAQLETAFDAPWIGYDVIVYPSGYVPSAARMADLDGDGFDDLVVSTYYSNPVLSVAMARGDGGFMPPGNSDCMGTEPEALNPWWSIWCVVARKTRSGRLICPEEGLSVMEAIRLYTTNSAYAGFEEGLKGSIEAGKLADFVVLDEDPFEVPVDGLKEMRVKTTVIGGQVVQH